MYPISFQEKIKNILAGWAACIFLVFISNIILTLLYPGYRDPIIDFCSSPAAPPKFYKVFFSNVIFAPLWEEALFRYFPFGILKHVPNRDRFMWPVIFGTSFIFGYMHGHSYNVAIQGLVGIVLAFVYIKNNYSYWSSVTLHALYNFGILTGLIVFP